MGAAEDVVETRIEDAYALACPLCKVDLPVDIIVKLHVSRIPDYETGQLTQRLTADFDLAEVWAHEWAYHGPAVEKSTPVKTHKHFMRLGGADDKFPTVHQYYCEVADCGYAGRVELGRLYSLMTGLAPMLWWVEAGERKLKEE
jgi:hypothetical protein